MVRRQSGRGLAPAAMVLASASSLALCGAAQAQAQTPPETEAHAVAEVVVTAQRREERLQDVPLAVSALAGGDLEKRGVDSTRELTQVVPSLNFTQSGFSPQPTIRGIGTRGVGAGDESAVPVYIDGVYQSFLPSLFFDLNNLKRVEVLKGPQGTLYGRNSTGGAINLITRTPEAGLSGDLAIGYGRFRDREFEGYVTGGTDVLAADLAYQQHQMRGYIRNIVTGKMTGGVDNYSVRSKIKFTPSDRFSSTLILANSQRIDFQQQANTPINEDSVGFRFNPRPISPTEPWQIAIDHGPIPSKVNQGAVALNSTASFTGFDVNTVFSYQRNRLKQPFQDTDATNAPASTFNKFFADKSSYNEVTLVSAGEHRLSWVAGLVYYWDVARADPDESVSANVTTLARTISTSRGRQETNSYAAYLQGAWKFDDHWTLTLGGRYTRDHKQVRNSSLSRLVTATVVPAPTTGEDEATFEKFIPSGTLQYQPTRDLNFYLRIGQGFKTGLFNTTAVGAPPVDPEVVTQYELGAKTTRIPGVVLNAAIYYTDYNDLQVTARDPVSSQSFLQNAASARIYGGEVSATFSPADRLNVGLALSALNGKYTDFPAAQVTIPATTADPTPSTACVNGTGTPIGGNRSVFCDLGGYKLTRVPFFTANLNADYTVDLAGGELTWTGNVYYSGKSYWDSLNRLEEPAHTSVSSSLAWWARGQRVGLEVWGENLTNAVIDVTKTTSATGDIHVYGAPRTYGVRLRLRY